MNEFTTMDLQEVISRQEALKKKYDFEEEDKKSRLVFFHPACVEDSETVAYIKNQILTIGTENEKPLAERCSYLRVTFGIYHMDMNGWIVSSSEMKYECGLILNNGKDKPLILYGELDCMNLGIDIDKHWPTTVEEAEALRLKHLIRPSKCRRTDEEWKKAEIFLGGDEDDNCGDFFTYWLDETDGYRWLQKVPETTGLAYTVAQIYLAYLALKTKNWQSLRHYALLILPKEPTYQSYWQDMIAQADKHLKPIQKKYLQNGFKREVWKKRLLTEARQALVGLEPETPFHTLVYDCNAAYGQILLSLDTEDDFKDNLERYGLGSEEAIEFRFNAGDFNYFETAHISLSDYDELKDIFDDMNIATEEFMIMACEGLLDLAETEEFKALPKTADFAIMCSDHDEMFRVTKERFTMVQQYYRKGLLQ